MIKINFQEIELNPLKYENMFVWNHKKSEIYDFSAELEWEKNKRRKGFFIEFCGVQIKADL